MKHLDTLLEDAVRALSNVETELSSEPRRVVRSVVIRRVVRDENTQGIDHSVEERTDYHRPVITDAVKEYKASLRRRDPLVVEKRAVAPAMCILWKGEFYPMPEMAPRVVAKRRSGPTPDDEITLEDLEDVRAHPDVIKAFKAAHHV